MEEVGRGPAYLLEESIVGTDISPFAGPGGGGSSALSGHQCLSETVLESRAERCGVCAHCSAERTAGNCPALIRRVSEGASHQPMA